MSLSKRSNIIINPGAIAVVNTLIAFITMFFLVACAGPVTEASIVTEPDPTPETVQAETVPPDPELEYAANPYAHVQGNTSGNISNEGLAAIQGDWIYYVSDDGLKIYARKTDSSGMKKINDDPSSNINVVGDWVYYLDNSSGGSGGQICAIKTDGSERRVINEKENIASMIVVGDWIYYVSFDRSINTIRIDGSGNRSITTAEESVSNMIMDGDWIYYNNWNDEGCIYAIRTDGSERRKVSDEFFYCIFIIDEWMYWFTQDIDHNDKWVGSSRIGAIKTDGSEACTILETKGFISSINTDGNWIYYANSDDSGKIFAIKPDGSEMRKVSDDKSDLMSIVGDWIYYLKPTRNYDDAPFFRQVYAIKTDGTERHLVGFSDFVLGIVNTPGGELTVRSTPDLSGDIIGTLENGAEIAIKDETNGFYIIGGEWWGNDAFVSVDGVDIYGDR